MFMCEAPVHEQCAPTAFLHKGNWIYVGPVFFF